MSRTLRALTQAQRASYRTGGCDPALLPSAVSMGLSSDHHEL